MFLIRHLEYIIFINYIKCIKQMFIKYIYKFNVLVSHSAVFDSL